MPTCQGCDEPITNKFLTTHCFACLDKAMDAVTPDDIAAVMTDLVARIDAENQK